jgi:hypothetical protein
MSDVKNTREKDFRFGSEADLMRRVANVCLAPQSGLRFRFSLGPLSATSRQPWDHIPEGGASAI